MATVTQCPECGESGGTTCNFQASAEGWAREERRCVTGHLWWGEWVNQWR